MKEDVISIIIPCYNNATTVKESVESCIAQTYTNFEVIIIDDGSTDNSREIIQSLEAQFPQVRSFHQNNKGPACARNFGASFAQGKYIVFLDADDKFAPSFLKECMNVFNTNQDVDIVYSLVEKFEEEEGIWVQLNYSPERILLGSCFPISSMVELEKFRQIGMFDEELAHAEDWEMWIRMTARYPNAYKIEKPLVFYRKRTTKDSISDLNKIHNYEDYTHLYIYNKHYELYRKYKRSINDLLWSKEETLRYKNKYYNEWYRKLIYKWFLRRKKK